MKKIQYTIVINAPGKKVWETIIGKETYPLWTAPFSPDSRVEGDWSEGSQMRFVGVDNDGVEGGLISEIAESRPYEFLSIKHLSEIKREKENGSVDASNYQYPAFENYTLKDINGTTEFLAELDAPADFIPYFDETWPKAMEKLKEICEK